MGDNACFIIDLGGEYAKFGVNVADVPSFVIPSLVAVQRRLFALEYANDPVLVGEEAILARNTHNLQQIKANGYIIDDYHLKTFLRYSINQSSAANVTNALVATSHRSSQSELVTYCDQIFSTTNATQISFINTNLLSLASKGLSLGLVLDIGDNLSQCSCITEGCNLSNTKQVSEIAGGVLTDLLQFILSARGYSLTSDDARRVIREAKEKYMKIIDCDTQQDSANLYDSYEFYNLPDGISLNVNNLEIGAERFNIPETLFYPELINAEDQGIHELIFSAINNAPIDYRSKLLSAIVLTGGTAALQGLVPRLENLIRHKFCGNNISVQIEIHPDLENSAWTGGYVFSQLESFNSSYSLSLEEYLEFGEVALSRLSL